MYTIEKIRRYPESILFLKKDGKRVCRMDRSNCRHERVGEDRSISWVEYSGLKIFYSNNYKVLKVEGEVSK